VKIAVCIKVVPAGRARFARDANHLERAVDSMMNRFDANAVEAALTLCTSLDDEVVLVSMGPPAAMDGVREGLAMGADRAVLISDEAAAGADVLATSYVLGVALEREEPDLVLFGQQSPDGDGALLCAAVAERLRLPLISQVAALELNNRTVVGRRQTETGYEVVESSLPAVIAVSDAINEPRNASLKGRMNAKKAPQDILALKHLGADPARSGASGSRTTVISIGPAPAGRVAERIEDPDLAVMRIAALVNDAGLVA
jgi:electron transfer flavoprotein beta subunit